MTFSLFSSHAAQRNSLVNSAVISHHCRLSDDHTASVVDQNPASQPFKLTYTDDKNLYIAVGYGAQPTGGYSISIRELYLTENSIVLATELMGPEKGEDPGTEKSFPYIVLRTELLEEPVIFK